MNAYYPILAGAIAQKGIKKNAIASLLEISEKTLWNKLNGLSCFTWPESTAVHSVYFPEIPIKELFQTKPDEQTESS